MRRRGWRRRRKPPANVSTRAHWGGSRISEESDRPCVLTSANPDGSYGCQKGDPAATCNFTDFPRNHIARKGDASFCDTFDGITIVPNSTYEYHWMESCSSGTCTVQILNWIFENHGIERAGLMRMTAFADATGPFTDANPFADPQTPDIDEIVIKFHGDGSNKTVAECRFTQIPVGDVHFTSGPQPSGVTQ